MVPRIKRLLAAPVFADEDKTRVAFLLNIILLWTVALNPIYGVTLLLAIPNPELKLTATALLFAFQLAALFLMHRGRVRLASILLIGVLWLYFNFVVLIFGGSRSPGIIGYFLIILMAGLLVGGRAAIALSAMSIVTGLGLLYLEVYDYLPPSLISITPVYTWMTLLLGIVVMAVLLSLATKNLNDALQQARRNAAALAENNRQLEAAQATLQERVVELKETEAALRLSEERLRTVVDNAPIILWGVSADGVLTLLQGKILDLIGFQPGQLVGSSIFEMSGGRIPQLAEKFHRALGGETFTSVEKLRERIFEMHYAPLHGDRGEVAGIIGVAIDITERRQAEEALLQAQKLESLGILAGGIAHDFNNLLVALITQTTLARDKLWPQHPAHNHIDKAVTAAERAATLTRQILAYSGGGQFEKQHIELNRLIEECVHLLRASVAKNVDLETHLSEPLPLIEGDAGQIQQVIMNLILNAAEAIGQESGTVTVVTKVEEEMPYDDGQWRWIGDPLPPGRYVTVEVRDDGCGMEEATLAKIFDPFITTKAAGRGLGLAAALGITRGHQGNLRVQSEPGHGSIFKLLLPPSDVSSVPTLEPVLTQRIFDQREFVVLVIDDEEPVREAVSDILDIEGMQVITAASGQAGVDLFKERAAEIDLVLLDLSMPGLSGEETFQLLREADPKVSIVLSSGYNRQDVIREFQMSDSVGFLQKPYSVSNLVEKIQEFLPGHPGRDSVNRQS